MSARPLVAVSQRIDSVPGRGERRDAVDQRLACWVSAWGGLPVPVPNSLGDHLSSWLRAVRPSAVLLSGGNDIGDCPERERTEIALLAHAAREGLRVLGICRGMQMLAHLEGGTLEPVSDHAATRHSLQTTDKDDLLPTEVNSFHNLRLAACPPSYEVLAAAHDGTIEAMRHRERRWEGWMWHPEREPSFGEVELQRARQLLIGDGEK